MTEIGLTQPAEQLNGFLKEGHALLETLKDNIVSPAQEKTLRTWKIKEAASIIGRSVTYIQKMEGDGNLLGAPDLDENGKRVYSLERINYIRDKLKCGVNRPPGVKTTVLGVGIFKGGCTKTTTTIHLGQRAALKGHKVLVIDLDAQASLSFLFGLLPEEATSGERTLDPVLIDGQPLVDSITPTYFPGLDLVRSSIMLQTTELYLYNEQFRAQNEIVGTLPLERLDLAIQELENFYDLIIIDFPPNLGMLTLSALKAITGLIIPVTPSLLDYQSALQFIDTFKSIRGNDNFGKSLDIFRLCVSRVTGNKEDQRIMSLLELTFKEFLLENVMVQSEEVKKAASSFSTVYETDKPQGSRTTYLRALNSLNDLNDEILGLVYKTWEKQSADIQVSEQEDQTTEVAIHD